MTQLREHYEVEKELANRLRRATSAERRHLYQVVYDERLQRIPHHPLLTQAQDSKTRMAAVIPQLRCVRRCRTLNHSLRQPQLRRSPQP